MIQGQSTIGIVATFARAPLTYSSSTDVTCSRCDADANVTQIFAVYHGGGGGIAGFHQVLELQVGAIIYANFREHDTDRRLEPRQDADLALGIGYGFGYSFSQSLEVEFVQEGLISVHQRAGLSGGDSSFPRQSVTRLGVRLGL